VRAAYDSEIAFTDAHIGRLLEAMKEMGVYDDTLIVLTADHGEEFLDHGRFGHSTTVYNELIHVPLIIKSPGQREGTVVEREVGLIDIYPTVLARLGITVKHRISGRSLDGEAVGRPVFSETRRGEPYSSSNRYQRMALMTGRHKLIWDRFKDRIELYDLAQDPTERTDLSKKQPETVERLKAQLAERHQQLRPGREADRVNLTDREIEELRALGYGT
jgi:arylsulfatase A-like enzyme